MSIAQDYRATAQAPSLRRSLAGALAFLTARRASAGAANRPDLTPGLAPEALIDADMARMASFGSWQALRDELRAHDQQARKPG
ncbi:hypothetical protein [Gemmobacter sp.]|uniref:hypothetical protein n=1 Tax=Gemmobacter sp. TaxID=1898957 RepID=UPI002AFE1185|nr:hypothetical protein [Gemmobacter sp.]